ncbi:Uncharacterised protein [Burkholderia pseudomallei]|nr:Uncharacterised protein [Burkholderia pseudomallei]
MKTFSKSRTRTCANAISGDSTAICKIASMRGCDTLLGGVRAAISER